MLNLQSFGSYEQDHSLNASMLQCCF